MIQYIHILYIIQKDRQHISKPSFSKPRNRTLIYNINKAHISSVSYLCKANHIQTHTRISIYIYTHVHISYLTAHIAAYVCYAIIKWHLLLIFERKKIINTYK